MQTKKGVYNPDFDVKFKTTEQGEVLTLTLGKALSITLPFKPIEKLVMEKRREKRNALNRR